jgi:hypothetical protein
MMAKESIDSLNYWRGLSQIKTLADSPAAFKKELIRNPKEFLKQTGFDPVVAIDEKNVSHTLGELLEMIDEKKRGPIATAILASADKLQKAQLEFEAVLINYLKPLPDWIPSPKIKPAVLILGPHPLPVPKVAPLVTPKVAPLVRPKVAPLVTPKVAPLVKPKVAPLVTPKVAPLVNPKVMSLIKIKVKPAPIAPLVGGNLNDFTHSIRDLELKLIEMEKIRKNLPARATKAEKKAAANAVQQITALLSATKKSEKNVIKKTVKRKK